MIVGRAAGEGSLLRAIQGKPIADADSRGGIFRVHTEEGDRRTGDAERSSRRCPSAKAIGDQIIAETPIAGSPLRLR